ncbi:PPOX class F420-dependent oxidoreductase [Salinibacterium sp. SWN1162]|uniref:PPOX class F420-dependent oxidoreductase n=1 Tax=Salinibacterium sp. SWN1162 TaxID=2792053 RepID=UPI0018CFDE2B|nr:PPOX class F420-dependent oxidoreductase [Salinibacterium sp. SWN1162]MBH0007874.1 PPOX class F420-dependent oxidoreductase [Salinibacterium sp. SWN1162]
MLSEKTRELAQGGHFASFTTLKADGQPCAQVMWVDCDDEYIFINTEVHRAKYKNVQRDPRVAVLIINKDNPYEYAEVRGTVVEEIHGAEARAHIDTLAWRYFNRAYIPEQIQSQRVILKIKPL